MKLKWELQGKFVPKLGIPEKDSIIEVDDGYAQKLIKAGYASKPKKPEKEK